MKIKILCLVSVVLVMLVSCTKDVMQPTVVPTNTSVKFSTDVYPVFSKYSCTGCHSAASPASGLSLEGTPSTVRTNLLTTNAVVPSSSATSPLYEKFANSGIHNGLSMTPAEVGNIKSWIDLGALNN